MCVGKPFCPNALEQPGDQRRIHDVHLPTAIPTSISVSSTGAASKEPADALVPVHDDSARATAPTGCARRAVEREDGPRFGCPALCWC